MGEIDLSPFAVTVQTFGTLVLAGMLALLSRVTSQSYARLWAWAWLALFLALTSIRVYIATSSRLAWFSYLILEWAFLFLLAAGCRTLVGRPAPRLRNMKSLLAGALIVAAAVVLLARSFNELFVVQAAIVSFGAGSSFVILIRAPEEQRRYGWRLLRGGLAAMAILFAAYVPLYAWHERVAHLRLLEFSSVADLFVAVVLGYAMILIAAEEGNLALRSALSELAQARSQLERKLHTDPLTNALSRHAFHSMQKGDDVSADTLTGVVVMIDIDNLKRINDGEGHAAGDAAIRAAANAIRSKIRADDLLFRWGGDEFVAVLPNSTLTTVRERFGSLREGVVARLGEGRELAFHLSWGLAEFGVNAPLDFAMRVADEQMYRSRLTRG